MARKNRWPEGHEHLEKYDPATFPKPADRPTALVVDCSLEEGHPERELERPLDDLEYADLLHRQEHAEAADAAPAVHPIVAQVAAMSEDDKAALRAALGDA